MILGTVIALWPAGVPAWLAARLPQLQRPEPSPEVPAHD
jgi:hypothetical protein